METTMMGQTQSIGPCPVCYDQGRQTPISAVPGQPFISCSYGHKIEGDAPMEMLSAMLTQRGLLGANRKSAAAQKSADLARMQDILTAANEPGAFAIRGDVLAQLEKIVGEAVNSGARLVDRLKVMLEQRRGVDDWSEAVGMPSKHDTQGAREEYTDYGIDGDVIVAAIARIGRLEARVEEVEKLLSQILFLSKDARAPYAASTEATLTTASANGKEVHVNVQLDGMNRVAYIDDPKNNAIE